ncbi:helix-turn-helix domain-containing protein [Pseudoflavonifractor phocaeensis]|uniref:helix-turn-helix domain-containing protein n=1 Tax=Pseudoflavonifractor phocaeensis TaxID=1870988 RepID=UPI00210AAB9A|nr:helix-turn-helix domain-containing protein [Pseudoflavonifractor phocaeensis]MCQ4864408.1 helix-turn-helix domain-containing protein [Pseudoflavonifractor phocaeensis]
MSTCQTNIDRDIVPLQPELSQQLHYSERLLKWNPYSKKNLALCYQFQTGRDGTPIRLIPDACIDFLFKCDRENPVAVVSGVQTAPRELVLAPDSVYFGFKPYSPKGMRPLGAAWHELTDAQISLEDDLRDAGWIAERLAAQETFDQRIAAIADFARLELTDDTYTPDFVELSELQLCQARGNIRMEAISDYTGYTGRYCREKFKEAHGISIKNYSSIMRFQNAVRMLFRQDDEASLSDIVFDNGYFDQSHLNREFRRFCGDTPLHFRREVLCRS